MTATTTTLADFLLARVSEAEATARRARDCQRLTWAATADSVAAWAGADIGLLIFDHSPTRVLAECEAKRAIVREHDSIDGSMCGKCATYIGPHDHGEEYPCPTLRALAQPYRDHPEFREEWV